MSCDWIPTVQLEKDCNRYRFIQAISNQGHSDTYCSGVEEMDFGGEQILPITAFCFFLIEKFFEKILKKKRTKKTTTTTKIPVAIKDPKNKMRKPLQKYQFFPCSI